MDAGKNIVSKLKALCYPQPRIDALDAAFCARARAGMKVLDAGCGGARGCSRKAPWEKMHIVGADIDPAVHKNPFCNETVVCDLSKDLPFKNETFDLIHCRWVIEHLKDPLKTFCEFARILKPGGWMLVLTPNVFHYAMIVAKFTPHWFHRWWRQEEYDPFPTYYRANSPWRLRQLCEKAILEVRRLELIEGPPQYFDRWCIPFFCGVLYERIVNSTSILGFARQRILLEAVALSVVKSETESES